MKDGIWIQPEGVLSLTNLEAGILWDKLALAKTEEDYKKIADEYNCISLEDPDGESDG